MDDTHNRWECISLSSQFLNTDKHTKTHVLRNFVALINQAIISKRLCVECCGQMYVKQAEQYAEYMDYFQEQGLNNYAAGALSLLQQRPTECGMWQSSLSLDSPDLACLSDYQTISKVSYAAMIPSGEAGRVLLKPGISVNGLQAPSPVYSSYQSIPPAGLNVPWTAQRSGAHSQHTAPTHNFMDIYNQKPVQIHTTVPGCFGNFGQTEPVDSSTLKKIEQVKRSREETADGDVKASSGGPALFRTARQQLAINNQKAHGKTGGTNVQGVINSYGSCKKSLGTRRGVNSRFVPPVISTESDDGSVDITWKGAPQVTDKDESVDERLKNIDSKMVELIMSEIMDQSQSVTWDDIAGLQFAKKTIQEIVVWPMLRPDIFTGLRGPPKGLLLFGPPGTGKTLIGKCIASRSKSTFFSISASSLTSKWVGEGEKMVRALFAVARVHQPAVIFIDEIDSLLSQRSDGEHESSRRIKTEFLVQLDGASTGETDRILVIGATNRPQELDEAARRRFVKRLYIPLPENTARQQIITNLMTQQKHQLDHSQLQAIVDTSKGYSGADMANLCREAALGPIRSLPFCDIETMTPEQVRPIVHKDFQDAFKQVRASVSDKDLTLYIEWNKQYGSWDIEQSE